MLWLPLGELCFSLADWDRPRLRVSSPDYLGGSAAISLDFPMGVLIEALSVIVPVAVLAERYHGGLQAYESNAPNGTFCTDGHLTRVEFMTPVDVKSHVEGLQCDGLKFHDGHEFVDVAIVD